MKFIFFEGRERNLLHAELHWLITAKQYYVGIFVGWNVFFFMWGKWKFLRLSDFGNWRDQDNKKKMQKISDCKRAIHLFWLQHLETLLNEIKDIRALSIFCKLNLRVLFQSFLYEFYQDEGNCTLRKKIQEITI